ncbi:hypothetical protein L584_05680 [Pantoea agglomerans Tx10]|nr:hypothetical protein L584_05680 [Pantoea agglomerans Tx10]SUB07446.1 Uncharacterised protein [Pantoea agglomerans]
MLTRSPQGELKRLCLIIKQIKPHKMIIPAKQEVEVIGQITTIGG